MRRLDQSIALDAGHLREAEDMIGQIVRDGVRLSLHDCDPIQREDHSVGDQEDFFSMFCLMLAAAVPDIKFEGLCRSANPEHYTRRHLTHAVCDARSLTFERSQGDPVFDTKLVSYIRTDNKRICVCQNISFPCILVRILTDDREALKQDLDIIRWIDSVNQIHFPEETEMEMISAEACYLWSVSLGVMLRAPSRQVCKKYSDELIALLEEKGYQTGTHSILREYECSGTHIQIPDSVTCIGDRAFRYHSELQSVVIPDSVVSISDSAFDGCISLEEVMIPDSVKEIGSFAFSSCKNLRNITLSQKLQKLDTALFSHSVSLESIQIPAGVTEIDRFVFHNCKKLKKVVIPEKVKSIKDEAFKGCESLESVIIPEGVTKIGKDVFIKCSPDLILYGKKGSVAERYAAENGLQFAEMEPCRSEEKTGVAGEKGLQSEKIINTKMRMTRKQKPQRNLRLKTGFC